MSLQIPAKDGGKSCPRKLLRKRKCRKIPPCCKFFSFQNVHPFNGYSKLLQYHFQYSLQFTINLNINLSFTAEQNNRTRTESKYNVSVILNKLIDSKWYFQ